MSTLVGVRFLQLLIQSAAGSGRILFLQYLIISCLPVTVVAVVGGGRGDDSGEICPGGRTRCNVGGTAAARTKVSCSGDTRFAMSASPLAAAA